MRMMALRTALLALTVAAALVVAVAAGVAHAASPPCNCYSGTVLHSAPRCVCSCSGENLAPFCSFRGGDTVRVQVWYNVTVQRFNSLQAVDDLRARLAPHVNASLLPRIVFQYNAPSASTNRTMALFDMPGMAVARLYAVVWDEPAPSWARDELGITAVFLTEELTAPEPYLTSLLRNTYLHDDGMVQVSLADAIWLIGVIALVLAVPLIEAHYTTNDEASIEADIKSGAFNPGAAAASKYKTAS